MGFYKDETGNRYGSLTVLGYAYNKNKEAFWSCKCDCGNTAVISGHNLRSGNTKTCGCSHHNRPHEDLTGLRFGRLSVTRGVGKNNRNDYLWECKCDCGAITIVPRSSLVYGNTRSCGCLNKDATKNAMTKHGKRYTRINNIYRCMKARVNNKNNPVYKHYGGRGITICDEWQSFEPFYEWAMSNGYADGLSIDRIDVNGNYCPENCRWVSNRKQHNNTRKTIWVIYLGETMPLSEFCERINAPYAKVYHRYRTRGWSIEQIANEFGAKKEDEISA